MTTLSKIKLNQRRLGWKRLTRKVVRRYSYWERQAARLERRGLAVWNSSKEIYREP
jgi:hypothetical protein